MSSHELNQEMDYMNFPPLSFITTLDFGEGKIGADGFKLDGETAEVFADQINSCVVPITKPNTANCPDGRGIVSLADGTKDPNILEDYVTHQLLGGLGLAVTKAASAANLVIIRDAKGLKDAYETMYGVLSDVGFEDGGHVGCGASIQAEASVAKQLPEQTVLGALPVFRPVPENVASLYGANLATKQRLLESGYYGKWDNLWHEAFLADKVPQNFAILAKDDGPTSGHYEEGVATIKQPGYGFAKNRFIRTTGHQIFAETAHTPVTLVDEISKRITVSPVERARFLLEFDVEVPHVLNQLVAKGLPLFA
jgi:hypothetical protein